MSILGQAAVSASVATDLYTVPKGKTCTFRIMCCEQAGASALFRVALRDGGATLASAHYISYDEALASNASFASEVIEMDADDVVTVYVNTTNTSWTVQGIEEPTD